MQRCTQIKYRQVSTQTQRQMQRKYIFSHTQGAKERWKQQQNTEREGTRGGGERKGGIHAFIYQAITNELKSQSIRNPSEYFLMKNKRARSVIYLGIVFKHKDFLIKFQTPQLQFSRITVLYSLPQNGPIAYLLLFYASQDWIFIFLIQLTQSVMGKHFKLLLVIQSL